MNRTQLRAQVKTEYLKKVMEILTNEGEEVLQVASNEITLPVVDTEGNEDFLIIKFSIPTKVESDGTTYDGYIENEMYLKKEKEKEEKRLEKERKKAEKIKRDELARQKKAELKAQRGE